MATSANYRENNFEYPDLTPIDGTPTFNTLQQLIREIKANAMSVHSNLGGGSSGHLGLVINQLEYSSVTPIFFIRPLHPGRLNIPLNANRDMQEAYIRQHTEQLRIFHEVYGVERALIQQLTKAVQPCYLSALRNRTTGQFTGNLLEILTYLKELYGKITPGELGEMYNDTYNFVYNPSTPVEVIFNKVEDLLEYSQLAGNTYSPNQLIALGYNILNKSGKFRDGIKEWNRTLPRHKNWMAFKQHFRQAYEELKETGDLVMEQTDYHQANLVSEIMNQLDIKLQTLNENREETHREQVPTYISPYHASAMYQSRAPTEMTLQTMQSEETKKLLEKIEALSKQVSDLTSTAATNTGQAANTPRSAPTGPRPGQPRNPGNIERFPHYCWTHGRSTHRGQECRNRAPGHKSNATFENKMSGSNFGCL